MPRRSPYKVVLNRATRRTLEARARKYTSAYAPDNVSMAAVALAISAGGALSSFETTVLLTVDETIDALRKASTERPARSDSRAPVPCHAIFNVATSMASPQ